MSGQRTYMITQPGYDFSPSDSQNQQWASQLFQRAAKQAALNALISWLRRRDNRLWYLHPATPIRQVRSCQLEKVNLNQIKGSTSNRSYDFDAQFRPLQSYIQARWVSVAAANRGRDLPPIELIKVDNAYFVVDGHHRLSVAQAFGHTEIAAHVTVYAIKPPQ